MFSDEVLAGPYVSTCSLPLTLSLALLLSLSPSLPFSLSHTHKTSLTLPLPPLPPSLYLSLSLSLSDEFVSLSQVVSLSLKLSLSPIKLSLVFREGVPHWQAPVAGSKEQMTLDLEMTRLSGMTLPLEARNATVSNVGFLNLETVTGGFGRMNAGIPAVA